MTVYIKREIDNSVLVVRFESTIMAPAKAKCKVSFSFETSDHF